MYNLLPSDVMTRPNNDTYYSSDINVAYMLFNGVSIILNDQAQIMSFASSVYINI